jgi:hypothetical protein
MSFVTGRCMCHELLRHPFEQEDVVTMVRKFYAGRVEFYDGEATVAPGTFLHRVGGHCRLQVVRVNAPHGPARSDVGGDFNVAYLT